MSIFDLNSAEVNSGGQGGGGGLIPENTVARAILTIRPGQAGDGGWLKQSSTGNLMLDTEWTITEGPYARRKIWRYMSLSEKAAPITMRQLRAAIEGNFGIRPDDMSEAAQAKRRVSIDQLNGIEACIMVGVEPASAGYEAKNTIKAVLAPGESKYVARGQVAPAAPHAAPVASISNPARAATPPAASAAAPAANKPAWAV